MHRINRVEIELEVDDVPLARELSDRAGRMHGRRLAPILDRVCGELSGPQALDRIESLEVDLGDVSAEDFEEDFAARLEPALRAALAAALGRGMVRRDQPAAALAALELLEVFALTGNLPWWADAPDREVVARQFARAAGEQREALVELLRRRIASDPVALDRMARACDPEALLVLAGEGGGDAGSVERRRALLRKVAGRVEERGEVTAEAGGRSREIEVQLQPEEPLGPDRPARGRAPAPVGQDVTDVRIGTERPSAPHENPEEKEEEAGAPLMLTAAEGRAAVPEREPPAVSVSEAMAQVHGESRPPPGAALRPSATPSREVIAASVQAAAAAARRAALARLDEVYVDDAGLVLLWPFLERFFVRVGLVDEKERRFAGEAAAIQAVALLEGLVAGEPEPLELQVALPKLLCGRPLESEFPLEAPLAPEQLAEGELLLSAVIDRARVLGELSIAGFRSTFLQRRGALTTRDGAWLLQVERQEHDLLLDRFPWSWGWVKLPWMPDPLQVEW